MSVRVASELKNMTIASLKKMALRYCVVKVFFKLNIIKDDCQLVAC